MGSSIKACYEMLEQEEYDKEIKECERFLKETPPEQLRLMISTLREGCRMIDTYGMGNRSFWAGVDKVRNMLEKMPKI